MEAKLIFPQRCGVGKFVKFVKRKELKENKVVTKSVQSF